MSLLPSTISFSKCSSILGRPLHHIPCPRTRQCTSFVGYARTTSALPRGSPAAAISTGGGSSGVGSAPPGGGSGRQPPDSAGNDQPEDGRGSFGHGRALAIAAAAYMLLALYQPWRLLAGLPTIDTSTATVSIIIPVYNEAGSIVASLQKLKTLQPAAAELVVVDGGSTDGTVKVVRKSGLADKVLASGRGRSVQMNAGAAGAKGDLLCFLHADTQPPRDLVAVMRQELRDPQTVVGGFVPSIEVPGRRLWLLSFHNFISTYYAPLLFRPMSYLRGLRNLFGDQTIFCRACDFKAVGGYDPRWVIMEDTDLCVRMHEAGPCRHHDAGRRRWPVRLDANGAASGRRRTVETEFGAGQHCQQQLQQLRSTCQERGGSIQQQGCGVQGIQQYCQQWLQPRGRVKQVMSRLSVTSGRRLDAWGPLRATYIHVAIGTSWYFRRDPEQLRELYTRLYTDAFR